MGARLIFDKSMGLIIGGPQFKSMMTRLSEKLKTEFNGGTSTQTSAGITVILHTGLKSSHILKRLGSAPDKYRVCLICDTIHFRSAAVISDPFVCPCGKTINK